MTASDIIQNVVDRVQDGSFSTATILALINEGRYQAASEVGGEEYPDLCLPALAKTASLSALSSASSVALPTDYHRNIYWVGSVNQGRRIGKRPGDYYNMLAFLEVFPIETGRIEAVCVEGANLLYRGKDTDTLTVKYYSKPVPILEADIESLTLGVPTEIPDNIQRPLLSAYCCREIYSEIEEGMEGPKTNTEYWGSMYLKCLADLRSYALKYKPREAKYVRDME